MGVVDLAVDHTMKQLTSNYNYPLYYFHLGEPIPFGLDIRQTKNPIIGDDYMNLYFLGDLNYNFKRNVHRLPEKNLDHAFLRKKDSAQIMISEHMLETIFTAMRQSGLTNVDSNSHAVREILQLPESSEFTTYTVAEYFPEFKNTFGNTNMKVTIEASGDAVVELKEDPSGDDSHFDITAPFLMSF